MMCDPIIYIVGDDNEPISTTREQLVYYEKIWETEIPYFETYDECMTHILQN